MPQIQLYLPRIYVLVPLLSSVKLDRRFRGCDPCIHIVGGHKCKWTLLAHVCRWLCYRGLHRPHGLGLERGVGQCPILQALELLLCHRLRLLHGVRGIELLIVHGALRRR